MNGTPGFWDRGPHAPFPVEETWREFVRTVRGTLVSDILPEPRQIDNADFIFKDVGVVAELKELQTEFSRSPGFLPRYDALMNRLTAEDPDWRPLLFGGAGKYPSWFQREYVRLFRPQLARILKKANKQLRDTKRHFDISTATGVLILVNDGFTSIGPMNVRALAATLLQASYSSVDCLLYMTVNRYVEVAGSHTPRLLWVPTYSDRAPGSLVEFIDSLGAKWWDLLEPRIGPFTARTTEPQATRALNDAAFIHLPEEDRGG